MLFDIDVYLEQQKLWSIATFGPGRRTGGVIEHIEKEIKEIKADPTDRREWIDIIILAIDGYWRCGGNSLSEDLHLKQNINFERAWPPSISEDKAVEHDRSADVS